ncbi:tRNA1(Val) (adenine(37)-N6)-methyltransferase [Aliivibrio kagoshimensis]|uniref:tRNA1(Val) (adenine(37)-N6)-methyltransferase n=1 Tax=Aliivibrio kagoshimensis TaxID=2910230 RepID=UPI003D1232EB
MANDFTFKQFQIRGHQCGMPVSTDGVLLGAWANISASNTILDIGCGTGLLSLMAAQRNDKANITAVEIEPLAFQAALDNCQHSPWTNRIDVVQSDIADFGTPLHQFDAIICNPPYFSSGEVSPTSNRAIARHTDRLSHKTLLAHCSKLLMQGGTASFILPKYEGEIFIQLLANTPLSLSRLTQVQSTCKKPVSRLLIEVIFTEHRSQNTVVEYSELLIHQGPHYSDSFIKLTKDFYLKM